LLGQPDALGPASARTVAFPTKREATERVAAPMSMLVHPSSAKDDHFDCAAQILGWAAGSGPRGGRELLAAGEKGLASEGIRIDLVENEQHWRRWLEEYRRGASVAASAMEVSPPPRVPEQVDWERVRSLILDDVVPGTTVAVINSDEHADDRPQFAPSSHDGGWLAPSNLSTIFVSGNVMSRGLTLEGLTTTYFSRRSGTPLADTQMQMQRWFGYRGSIIHLCRIFLSAEQLVLFQQYHSNDEALRRDVLAAMGANFTSRPPLAVLQGARFSATGKVANLRASQLWPGYKPFVRLMNPAGHDEANLELVAGLFESQPVLEVPASTGRQGLLLQEKRSLIETAELLDGLRYQNHQPGTAGPENARWSSIENHAGLSAGDPCWPLYRAPAEGPEGRDLGVASPYWIAAYLRLWAAALERRIPGMYTTDEPSSPWSLVDLEAKVRQQPRFSIGIRFGDGVRVSDGPMSRLPVAAYGMKRKVDNDQLEAGWGARGRGSEGIHGDEVFDLRARGLSLREVADGPRPPGQDGQVLFHLVERDDESLTLAVGVVLPVGGPDNVEAVSPLGFRI
jgi:hypothetical protein